MSSDNATQAAKQAPPPPVAQPPKKKIGGGYSSTGTPQTTLLGNASGARSTFLS